MGWRTLSANIRPSETLLKRLSLLTISEGFNLAPLRPSLRTSEAVHRCQDAVLDDGSKRDGVGLAVKPSVRISLDLARIAEPKINLANGVAHSKVATRPARTKPKAAITRGVTGASDAFAPYASPLPAQPLTDLPA